MVGSFTVTISPLAMRNCCCGGSGGDSVGHGVVATNADVVPEISLVWSEKRVSYTHCILDNKLRTKCLSI